MEGRLGLGVRACVLFGLPGWVDGDMERGGYLGLRRDLEVAGERRRLASLFAFLFVRGVGELGGDLHSDGCGP